MEIALVISGRGVYRVGEPTTASYREIGTGDIVVINFNVPHGFFTAPRSAEELVLSHCAFLPEFLDASLFLSDDLKNILSSFLFHSIEGPCFLGSPAIHLSPDAAGDAGDLIEKMHQEYRNRKNGSLEIIRAYLIELLVRIIRSGGTQDADELRAVKRMMNTIEYVNEHFRKELGLEDLARRANLSKSYFCTLFREKTGSTLCKYLRGLRIEEACRLLKTTDLKIEVIMRQAGFNDMKYFYNAFKSVFGMTPGAYRTGGFATTRTPVRGEEKRTGD
jgi:AraC family L-rhamnose operon transcriptional activator RhaR